MAQVPVVPRGPKGVPLLGSLPQLSKDVLAFQRLLASEYRPIASIKLGMGTYYVLTDAQLIEEFLVGKHRDCVKDALTADLRPLVGMGLLTSDGDPWRRQRKLAAPAFQPKNIAAYADVMVESAERAFGAFRDGEARNFHPDIMALTLEIVGKTLLGIDTREDTEAISAAIEDVLAYFDERLFTLRGYLPNTLPTKTNRKFHRAKASIDAMADRILDRSRTAGPEAGYLMARLVHARDEYGQGMTRAQLIDEAVTLLLAGHETTALAIMYLMYVLAMHPEVRTRLQAEIDQQLGERPPTMADLSQLPYLDAVCKETLRLFPPAPIFGREVAVPIELAGFGLPRGAQVHISPFAIQRDARYFKDPEDFRPERWLDGSTDDLPKFAYFPFGGGPRVCIGQHFAMMEMKLLGLSALRQLELDLQPGFELELQMVVTMRSKDGLPVRVRRRTPGAGRDAVAASA